MECVYMGGYTAKMLAAAEPDDCAAIVKAIVEWAETGVEPQVPERLRLVWSIVREESVHISEVRKARKTARKHTTKCDKAEQTESKRNKTDKAEQTESKSIEMEKEIKIKNIPTSDDARAREDGRDGVSVGSSGRRSSVEISQDFPSVPPDDPVDEAMDACLSEKQSDRRCFGRLLQRLGEKEFLDVVRTVAAEFDAGELPANRAATLNARLQARLTVIAGIGGVA